MEEYIDRIFNEDCLVGMDRIPDKSIDCIICDLPYGKLNHLEWDVQIPFDKLWQQYDRVAKDNAAVLLFGVEPFTSLIVMSNVKNYRQKLTWLKKQPSNVLNAKKQFMNWTEDIVVFYRSLPTFNPQFWDNGRETFWRHVNESNDQPVFGKNGKKIGYAAHCGGEKTYPKSVIEINEWFGWGRKDKLHPTQKPVDLIRYLIRTYTNPGDIILDNCLGSGTTAVAAINEGRHFVGFELEKKYYDICIERIKDAEEVKAVEDAKIRLF